MTDQITYGKTLSGEKIECLKLSNTHGTEVHLLNLGASIHRIRTADQSGRISDIVLYCDSVDELLSQKVYLGATIGRYANRIHNSSFILDGKKITLLSNEGSNQLHGGPEGFDKRLWDFKLGQDEHSSYVQFKLISPDGDQGYPGQLTTTIKYRLFNNNQLKLDIQSVTTETTVVNITNHAYFNLSGNLLSDLKNHYVTIPSKAICESGPNNIPTGQICDLKNSALNLEYPVEIDRLLQYLPQELIDTEGFDHNYIFDDTAKLNQQATVFNTKSSRKLTLYSTYPGLQFYTGNHLGKSSVYGPNGIAYKQYNGFCLEPQHYPDSPNHPSFPSTRLEPEDIYHQQIIYQFGLV